MGGYSFVDLASRLPLLAVVFAVLGFLRWLIPFVFARLDVGAAALGRRLRHVEDELDRHREALMLLINETALKDPTNKVLQEVARILSARPTRASMELDEIVAGLGAIGATGKGRGKA